MSEQADRQAKLLIALDFLRENHFADQAEIFDAARVLRKLKWRDNSSDGSSIGKAGRLRYGVEPVSKTDLTWPDGTKYRWVDFNNTWRAAKSLEDGKRKAESHWQSLFLNISKGVVE